MPLENLIGCDAVDFSEALQVARNFGGNRRAIRRADHHLRRLSEAFAQFFFTPDEVFQPRGQPAVCRFMRAFLRGFSQDKVNRPCAKAGVKSIRWLSRYKPSSQRWRQDFRRQVEGNFPV